jgi:hypothetical protein
MIFEFQILKFILFPKGLVTSFLNLPKASMKNNRFLMRLSFGRFSCGKDFQKALCLSKAQRPQCQQPKCRLFMRKCCLKSILGLGSWASLFLSTSQNVLQFLFSFLSIPSQSVLSLRFMDCKECYQVLCLDGKSLLSVMIVEFKAEILSPLWLKVKKTFLIFCC